MTNIRELTPELAKQARENFSENPDRLQDDISALRSWIEKQPHLITRTDDQYIVTFLRCCNFSREETKKRIEAFLTAKTIYPEIFKHRSMDDLSLAILRSGMFTIPPKPLPESSRRIMIIQLANFAPKQHTLRDIFKLQFMICDILAFEDDYISVNGIEMVYDLKNCTFQQVLHLDPVVLKKVYIYQAQCMPAHLYRVHVINLRKELQGAFKFSRTFTPTELPFELILHENLEDLYEYIPKESLSTEYGGQNGCKAELLEEWENKLQDRAEYIAKDSLCGTNETLRQGEIIDIQTDFGLEGSFRKLEID